MIFGVCEANLRFYFSIRSANSKLHYRWIHRNSTSKGQSWTSDKFGRSDGCPCIIEDYLVKILRKGQVILVRETKDFLRKNQQKWAANDRENRQELTKIEVGQYVLKKMLTKMDLDRFWDLTQNLPVTTRICRKQFTHICWHWSITTCLIYSIFSLLNRLYQAIYISEDEKEQIDSDGTTKARSENVNTVYEDQCINWDAMPIDSSRFQRLKCPKKPPDKLFLYRRRMEIVAMDRPDPLYC